MSRFLRFLSCLCVLVFILVLPAFAEQDKAAGFSRYEVSPRPNYLDYSDLAVKTNLNDGKYADSPMWVSSSALAWKDVRRVSITLDLGVPVPIRDISFHGASRIAAGVELPYNAFIYLSLDGKLFRYVGDAVDFAESSIERYEQRRFSLAGVGKAARFVHFEFTVRGRYFAIDEIEIERGGIGAALEGNMLKSEILVDADNRASNARDVFLQGRLSSALDRLNVPPGNDLLKRRAAWLAMRFPNQRFLLSDVDPWGNEPVGLLPKADVSGDRRRFILEGGCDYRSFALTNTTQSVSSFQLRQVLKGTDIKADLKEAKTVIAATLATVVDPLVSIGTSVEIAGGETKVLFLRVCGSGTHTLIVEALGQKASASTYLEAVRLSEKKEGLSGVVWAYLDEPALQGRQKVALADLRNHYINVDVVPRSSLPDFGSESFDQIVKVFERSVGARHVLLFLNFRGNPPLIQSSSWSQQFIIWYARINEAARQAGIDPKNLILYPYDEPSLKEMDSAEEFYLWVRKFLPEAKLFATFDTEKVAARLLRQVDIACVTRGLASKVQSDGNVWLYDVKGPGKANPPYSYYMFLPWEAYIRGMGGVGFWSYADIQGSAWNDFDGRGPDYGVVYQGRRSDDIVGSRRWEAWKRGMEDIEILRSHARLNGTVLTTRIATKVLALPGDSRQADLARQSMLSALRRAQ